MNHGQSEKLKQSFPNITTNIPMVKINDKSLVNELNPFWITGFITGVRSSGHFT